MITLIAAALAANVPAAQAAPANPHAQHMPAGQQTTGQPAGEHKMDGMKGCCCCKDMDGKSAAHAGPAKPAGQDHSGH